MVNANRSLWRSHVVLSTDTWNITNIDMKILCRLLRSKSFRDIEKITTANNPKMSTIDELTTILVSTWKSHDIVYSNDM
jgi:hypothetical protein